MPQIAIFYNITAKKAIQRIDTVCNIRASFPYNVLQISFRGLGEVCMGRGGR